jgi:thioredoxin-related protein
MESSRTGKNDLLFTIFDTVRPMRLTLILCFLFLFLSSFRGLSENSEKAIAQGENDTIKWYSFNEGHAKAVRENKILLVNVSTTSCYGCKLMFKYTYTHQGVIDTLNKYFVCVYFNPYIDTSYILNGSKVTPQELQKYLFVDDQLGYPSSIFWFHPENEEKHSVHSGYMEPPLYLKLLAAARAIRPFSSLGMSLQLDVYRPSHGAP